MTSASREDKQGNHVDSSSEHSDGSAFYISAGMTLSSLRREESSDSDSDESAKWVLTGGNRIISDRNVVETPQSR
jgi:hypothetical protein